MRELFPLSEKKWGKRFVRKHTQRLVVIFLKSGSGNKGSTEGQNNSVEFFVLSSLTCYFTSTVVNLLLQNMAMCLSSLSGTKDELHKFESNKYHLKLI